ncbi:MAG: UDP-N-acetylmuramoylalanine--D-glutamate ligase, partial [Planctomycetota bacterium]
VPTTRSATLREALPKALAATAPGDALLWSPAFASFDQYPNFRARALEFHALLADGRAAGAASG